MRTEERIKCFGRLAFLLASLLVIAGCGGGGGETASSEEERFPVEVVKAEYASVAPTLSYSGTVIAGRKALLGAQIQGAIEKLYVDTGDKVRKGDLLVELASEQLTSAEAQYLATEKDWNRMKSLLESGAVTQQAFDRAGAGYQAVKATYEMVLESTRIRAPFDGVITGRYLDEGEVFTMMSTATSSPAILELSNIDEVKVLVEVAAKERPLARVGLLATVKVDAHPGHTFSGSVKRIDPGLDRMSRTSTADVLIANPRGELMPGMFADVELTLSEKEGLLVTRDAMIRQEGTGSFYAYVVENGTAQRRSLTLGDGFGEKVEVLAGLSDGDLVITAGRYKLHDGAPVYGEGVPGSDSPAGDATGGEENR
jgi:membrane fusion protein (multidrug efflux system)